MNIEQEAQIGRAIFRESREASVIARSSDLRVLSVNTAFRSLTGRDEEISDNLFVGDLFIDSRIPDLNDARGRQKGFAIKAKNGASVPVCVNVSRLSVAPEPLAVLVIRDMSEHAKAERREESRREILVQIATGRPLKAILELIVAFVEQDSPDARCSILLLDSVRGCLLHGAAPNLPDFYNQAVHGLQIGEGVGSCGTAAFTKQRVIVEDIQTHPYWASARDIAKRAGVRSCWSDPILSYTGEVLGTFAVYHTQPQSPTDRELESIELSTHLASIAIERTQAEHTLQESQRMLRMVLDSIPMGVFWKDRASRYLGCNRVVANAFGLGTPEQIIGMFDRELSSLQPEQADFFVATDRQVMESEQAQLGILEPASLADGSTIWMETNKIPMRDPAGRVAGILGTWQDVTDRRRADEALRESENRLRTILEAEPECVKLLAADGSLLEMNPAGLAMIDAESLDQVKGHCVYPLVVLEHRPRFQALIEQIFQGESGSLEFEIVSLKGRRMCMEMRAVPLRDAFGKIVAALSVTRDVTERKKAEEERRRLEAQLLHAQKLESLGVLAGGLAHDFNNLLTGILGYVDLALLEVPAGSAASEFLGEAVSGARRAAELTRQMLAYSGKGRFVVEAVDLSKLVEEMARLLQVSISKKCTLKFDLMPNLPAIEADVVQIRQVIMNLIINASEAIDERTGVIAVNTRVIVCERQYLANNGFEANLPDGEYVCLEVTDTGSGMLDEVRERIFDPFFSTKFTGRGLGLSAVLGIVRGHRGSISCRSEPDKGTTFKVLFPPTNAPPSQPVKGSIGARPWQGTGTVLVVDDEESVCHLAKKMFEAMGFSVLTARDGREGLAVFKSQPEKVSLVLLDMTMPYLDGAETFREMRRISPHVRAILSSGYNEQSTSSRFTGLGLAGFLQKPYRFDDLKTAVRKALENPVN